MTNVAHQADEVKEFGVREWTRNKNTNKYHNTIQAMQEGLYKLVKINKAESALIVLQMNVPMIRGSQRALHVATW
jgi:hypothetical protein